MARLKMIVVVAKPEQIMVEQTVVFTQVSMPLSMKVKVMWYLGVLEYPVPGC